MCALLLFPSADWPDESVIVVVLSASILDLQSKDFRGTAMIPVVPEVAADERPQTKSLVGEWNRNISSRSWLARRWCCKSDRVGGEGDLGRGWLEAAHGDHEDDVAEKSSE